MLFLFFLLTVFLPPIHTLHLIIAYLLMKNSCWRWKKGIVIVDIYIMENLFLYIYFIVFSHL